MPAETEAYRFAWLLPTVTEDDVAGFAAEFYDPARFSAACIGRDEDCFRTATGAVSEALVA